MQGVRELDSTVLSTLPISMQYDALVKVRLSSPCRMSLQRRSCSCIAQQTRPLLIQPAAVTNMNSLDQSSSD